MVKMVNCSNIFVIVGSQNNKNLNEKEILIWDDKNQKRVYKILVKKEVLNLEITSDEIVVVCENIIYIFNLKNFQLIDIINTGKNPKGLLGISFKERKILVYPSLDEKYGKLTIKNYDTKKIYILMKKLMTLNIFQLIQKIIIFYCNVKKDLLFLFGL